MNNLNSTKHYNILYLQNPTKVDHIIQFSKLSTCGGRAIASNIYEIYFNLFKQSIKNAGFYDVRRQAHYIICKNKTIKAIKSFNNNAISIGKKILKELGLITIVHQHWNSPDRIYLNGFRKIYDSMFPKKPSVLPNHKQTPGDLKGRSLLQKNNIPKTRSNSSNTKVNTSKPKKDSKSKINQAVYAQKINRWVNATTNCLTTFNVSKEHAHNIAVMIARVANKDYNNAKYLFKIMSKQWRKAQRFFNIKKRSYEGLENIHGLSNKLQQIYRYELDPSYHKVSFKNYIGYVVNSLKRFYLHCAYELKDTLDPYYFNEAKVDIGSNNYHPDYRPVHFTKPAKKGPHIPIFKI